jgi:hypothetical protein
MDIHEIEAWIVKVGLSLIGIVTFIKFVIRELRK